MTEQTDPKVGIVGANGQVGTELCFLLRDSDVQVIPIVRNSIGAATFAHYGFDVRIADVGEWSDAKEALSDLDVTVVAAFASPLSRGDFKPKRARRTNESLVRNSVKATPDGGRVVYLSSVAAFGKELNVSEQWWYCREKRHIEKTFQEACETHQLAGYIYRVGLVLGANISRTADIESELASSERVDVQADATAPSNTVHTVTIADSVLACANSTVQPGTYTIVNEPQWTWQRVFDHYRTKEMPPEINFVGAGDSDGGLSYRTILSEVVGHAADHKTSLMSLGFFLPDAVNQLIFNRYMQSDVGGEISAYEDRFRFHKREFDYAEAPGEIVPGVKPTEDRLSTWEYPPEIFDS